jgi:hypothetical protein
LKSAWGLLDKQIAGQKLVDGSFGKFSSFETRKNKKSGNSNKLLSAGFSWEKFQNFISG